MKKVSIIITCYNKGEYVKEAVEILDEHPEIGVVYCKADFIGERQGIWNLPDFDKDEILYNVKHKIITILGIKIKYRTKKE